MKKQKKLSIIAAALTIGVLCAASSLYAEDAIPGRDLAVDAALTGGKLGGMLPATAGNMAAGGLMTGQQAFIDPARPDQFPDPALMVSDKADKKARVYEIKGNVKMTKKGTKEWKTLRNSAWVEEGDAILTEKGAYVSVAFDARYQNVTHIPQNTRAVFKSIEPLDLFIEDGTVFNIFDGLSPSSQWKVSTPTAVATVRGTHLAVQYTSASGDFFTATFNVPDDAHDSIVELLDVLNGGGTGSSAGLPEGQQITLKEGETLDPSLFSNITQEWIDQIMDILKRLAKFRANQGGSVLPPTSGEFFDPNVIDPAGSNMVGGGPDIPEFDPLDDTNAANFPEPPSEQFSSDSEPSEKDDPCPECNEQEPPLEECGSECDV